MIYNKICDFNKFLNNKGRGRLISIDLGRVNIGIAISDENRIIVTPKMTIKRKSNEKDFEQIYNLINENKVIGVVIGLPLNMKGDETEFSAYVRKFGDSFNSYIIGKQDIKNDKEIGIIYFDERLTSQMAEDMLIDTFNLSRQKRKKIIDKVAAGYILEGFLNSTPTWNKKSQD
ncbi:Holliday junction resolvase RuvX [Pseudomonadota bacterium]